MDLEYYIKVLENMMMDLSSYERNGLDTSSLRLFLKNLKTFQKIQEARVNQSVPFSEKLLIIKSFLEDSNIFPKIKDIIDFANTELGLEFKDQKERRDVTIRRIIGRIEETPELKEKVKKAVMSIRNQIMHGHGRKSSKLTKRDIESAESFAKWAEILKNL